MANKKSFIAPKPAPPKPVKYVGMFKRVIVPEANTWFEQGETKEVPGELADRLLQQPANWEEGKKADESKPKKKADEPEPVEEGEPEEDTE